MDDRSDNVQELLDLLHEEYPDSTISLRFSDRFELLVAVILSAQCTDERVNAVTEDLFETYATVADFAAADKDQLASALYSITYHNQKAGYLIDAATHLLDEHDGEVPDTMSELTEVPGVGRKTANVVLQHGHDVVEGIVVDTHVQRLSQRLGLVEASKPEAIEAELMDLVPEDEWVQFTHLLIDHGRAVCTARSPACDVCVLESHCPSSRCDPDAIDLASDEPWGEYLECASSESNQQ